MPPPPGRPAPMPGLPTVEQRDHAELLQRLVERVGHRVVGVKRLQARVELEPAHAVLVDQRPRLAHRGGAPPRVDAGERDQHVGVLGAGPRPPPRWAPAGARSRVSASTVNTTAAIRALPVVVGDRFDGRRAVAVGLEVPRPTPPSGRRAATGARPRRPRRARARRWRPGRRRSWPRRTAAAPGAAGMPTGWAWRREGRPGLRDRVRRSSRRRGRRRRPPADATTAPACRRRCRSPAR